MSNISIGKDKWIKWVDFNRYVYDQCIPINYDQCFEIDYLLEPTFDFWNKLETECVAGCCGINAYNLCNQVGRRI